MLYLSKLESKLDEALSKETRESLTEWIGHKRKKPLNQNNMALEKTKKMLQEYINKNRKEQRGRPITDIEIRQVKQELKKYERMYKFYMISTILLFVTLLVVVINN